MVLGKETGIHGTDMKRGDKRAFFFFFFFFFFCLP